MPPLSGSVFTNDVLPSQYRIDDDDLFEPDAIILSQWHAFLQITNDVT